MSPSELFLLVMFIALLGAILSGMPAMLAIAGVPMLVAGVAGLAGEFNLNYLATYPGRVWGIMTNPLLIAVPLFVLMGVLLERSRLAERMLQVVGELMGSSSRRLVLSVLVFSALIAASTGIIGATVVMLGLVSLPAMLQAGVPRRTASGVICASGTLGQIIPPSIVLVLLGDQIGNTYLEAQQKAGNFAPDPVSVGHLFAGALVPGLLLVALYGLYIFLRLGPAPESAAREKPERGPVPLTRILGTLLPPLVLIVAVLGSILGGVATTTEAAGLGAVGALLLAGFSRGGGGGRILIGAAGVAALVLVALRSMALLPAGGVAGSPAGMTAVLAAAVLAAGVAHAVTRLLRAGLLGGALIDTVRITGMVFGIVIAASMLSLVFRGFDGDSLVAGLMTDMPGGPWGALAMTMLVVFLLGFILEAVEIIYIVVPLLGAPLLATDFSPVWIAVLLAMNLQTSFLTPPFGFALFYFRSVAPRDISSLDIYYGVMPFVAIQLLALGVLISFPELATWLPELVFH
ncbi:MAG TPA: TRAP transporter large permease subunit [Arenicellales bacterium]|nr:TRAP transporter large permease subunit [Arenicellales bacterium]